MNLFSVEHSVDNYTVLPWFTTQMETHVHIFRGALGAPSTPCFSDELQCTLLPCSNHARQMFKLISAHCSFANPIQHRCTKMDRNAWEVQCPKPLHLFESSGVRCPADNKKSVQATTRPNPLMKSCVNLTFYCKQSGMNIQMNWIEYKPCNQECNRVIPSSIVSKLLEEHILSSH